MYLRNDPIKKNLPIFPFESTGKKIISRPAGEIHFNSMVLHHDAIQIPFKSHSNYNPIMTQFKSNHKPIVIPFKSNHGPMKKSHILVPLFAAELEKLIPRPFGSQLPSWAPGFQSCHCEGKIPPRSAGIFLLPKWLFLRWFIMVNNGFHNGSYYSYIIMANNGMIYFPIFELPVLYDFLFKMTVYGHWKDPLRWTLNYATARGMWHVYIYIYGCVWK